MHAIHRPPHIPACAILARRPQAFQNRRDNSRPRLNLESNDISPNRRLTPLPRGRPARPALRRGASIAHLVNP